MTNFENSHTGRWKTIFKHSIELGSIDFKVRSRSESLCTDFLNVHFIR